MKRFLTALLVVLLTPSIFAAASPKDKEAALPDTETIVWAGLDYSQVRMIGTEDFKDPEKIFPVMFEAWNSLFLQEMIQRLEKSLKRTVLTDTSGMTARNQTADPATQIIREDGSESQYLEPTHITPEAIARSVKAYELEAKEGLGLAFILDRLVKQQRQGAVYVVFFDIATREVLVSERQIHKAAGFGFRNYWFRVVKDAVAPLKEYR